MKAEKLKELHELFYDFIPIFHHKFSMVFNNNNCLEPKCYKNQIKALFIISKHNKITPSELGKYLDLRRGSLTALIDSLEQLNLVYRQPDAQDRRKLWLNLTQEGNDYLVQIKQIQEVNFIKQFSEVPENTILELQTSFKHLIDLMKTI